MQSRSGGTCGPVGDPDPNCPSACSAKAQPCCPGSPPAGRSSFRMSRRCCVASSMSMLAQEAMGPATGALSAPSSCRCRCALSSRVQPHRGQTAGCRSLHSVHPQPTNRGPRRVPEPLQPHQPPPLPARPIFGSRNLHLLKKGSGLGADALLFLSRVSSDAPPVCQRGPGSLAGPRQGRGRANAHMLYLPKPYKPQDILPGPCPLPRHGLMMGLGQRQLGLPGCSHNA